MDERMPQFLPMFPLELVAFPGQSINLHIFEPRYKELISECEATSVTFGIPVFHEKRLVPYGTEMKLVEIHKRYPDGEMDVRVQGLRGFRLVKFIRDVPGHLYSGGEVMFLENANEASPEAIGELSEAFNRFHQLLGTGFSSQNPETEDLAFRLGEHVGLDMPQKIRLLSLERESERQTFLLEHIKRMVPLIERAEEVKRRIGGNGHFQNLPKLSF